MWSIANGQELAPTMISRNEITGHRQQMDSITDRKKQQVKTEYTIVMVRCGTD